MKKSVNIEISNGEEIFCDRETEIVMDQEVLILPGMESKKFFLHAGSYVINIIINGKKLQGYCINPLKEEPAKFQLVGDSEEIHKVTDSKKQKDMRGIMRLAWQFFKQTGKSFSECLKQAWRNFKLKSRMLKGIVKFYYQKVDGTIREAWGTLNPNVMGPVEHHGRKSNPTVQVYFDTKVNAWRSFKKLNVLS